MNRVEIVRSREAWQEVIPQLGKNGIAAAAWQVVPTEMAQEQAAHIVAGISRKGKGVYADASRLPRAVIDAAYDVALECKRFPLEADKTIRRAPNVFGPDATITGVHVDIAKENGVHLSPPLNSLYIATGAVRGYFRSVSLDMIHPDPDEFYDHLGEWDTKGNTDNGLAIRPEEIPNFGMIEAPAGMILAFPNAGSYERTIQPTAHQIETLGSEPRHSIAISDVHFRPDRFSRRV